MVDCGSDGNLMQDPGYSVEDLLVEVGSADLILVGRGSDDLVLIETEGGECSSVVMTESVSILEGVDITSII